MGKVCSDGTCFSQKDTMILIKTKHLVPEKPEKSEVEECRSDECP